MAQAKISNKTACEVKILFSNDEEFRPLVAPIVKATFDISDSGQLKFSKNQIPVNFDGEYYDDPENSSYVFEPEAAYVKPGTDVVVIGDAVSRKGAVTHLLVEIKIGDLYKKLGIFGNRYWLKQSVGYVVSEIEPFEHMPLVYENAFGGWDRRHQDPNMHGFDARNTVGKGFYRGDIDYVSGIDMPLPNIENPDDLISSIKDQPAPVGCGFTLPHWMPRAKLAGTYDSSWEIDRNPLLPKDFDRRYFNAASGGLISEQYLTGKEAVSISNMTAGGILQFYLPGARPPVVEIEFADTYEEMRTVLDTVIINLREMQLQLIWRNYLLLKKSPHDVEAVSIRYG